mgnify:CR=1 FL=1
MAPAAKHSHDEQETMILNAAAECIWETSILDFTMSAVGKKAGLSMGSIYKHVQCKEDIIFALARRVFVQHSAIFADIMGMEEFTTPEKVMAIALLGPAKIQVYPFDNQLQTFANNEAVIRRASNLWTERMMKACEVCEEIFRKSMHKAAYNRELILNSDIENTVEHFNLSCWALIEGYQSVRQVIQLREITEGTDSLMEPVGLDEPLITGLTRLINSYDWQTPITQEATQKVALRLEELGLR